jgi:pilus assembly protein Flp/PilA
MLGIQEGLRTLVFREEGQDLVEYALLVSLIALTTVAGIHPIANAITTAFTNVSTTLT